MTHVDKRDVAIEHLRVAMRAYLDDGDNFVAAVLGHTAGDILDSTLKGHGAETALDELVAGTKAMQRQVFGDEPEDSAVRKLDRAPRNAAKHMDVTAPGDWSDRLYPHNARQAAFDAIDLALDNLYRLGRIESFDLPDFATRWDRERPARPQ